MFISPHVVYLFIRPHVVYLFIRPHVVYLFICPHVVYFVYTPTCRLFCLYAHMLCRLFIYTPALEKVVLLLRSKHKHTRLSIKLVHLACIGFVVLTGMQNDC